VDQFEKKMFAAIDRNHELRALADRLNAISARRRKKGAKK
jgi:hypothetical protein